MKWIRNILKGVSLTAAMFVFQACYGTMEDYYDVSTGVTFRVVDSKTGQPMEGVRIWSQSVDGGDTSDVADTPLLEEYTDENGMATIWAYEGARRFSFVDSASLYTPFDTVINIDGIDTVDIALKKAIKR